MSEQVQKWMRIFLGILLFGSLWGALEATLGGLLAVVHFPQHGAVMANIGFLTMGAAFALYRRPGMPLGIAAVAASFKLLDVAIFQVPPLTRMVINPMVAIILEALAFEGVALLILRRWPRNVLAQAGAGAAGMLLSYAGIALAFNYLTQMGPRAMLTDPLGWVLQRGGFAAALALVALPLGLGLGGLLRRVERRIQPHPTLYYAGSVSVILLAVAAAVWGTLRLG